MIDGSYLGSIDGRWGQGSQTGLEAIAARTDLRSRTDGIVRNYHVAALASDISFGTSLSRISTIFVLLPGSRIIGRAAAPRRSPDQAARPARRRTASTSRADALPKLTALP
jgi:hypothetical protein